MRKILLFLVLLLVLPFASVRALDAASGPAALAQYAPANATLFVAVRTDDGYLDELQAVVDRVQSKIPADLGVPTLNLRESLMQQFAGAPVSYEDVRAAIGDTIAVSGDTTAMMPQLAGSGSAPNTAVAVEVGDRAAIEKLLQLVPGIKEGGTEGDYTLYTAEPNAFVALSDSVMIVTTTNELLTGILGGENLAGNAAYTATVSALPADSYNIVAYVDLAAAVEATPNASSLAATGMTPENLGTLAVGMTILDERSLVMDIAQVAEAPAMFANLGGPIDPAFTDNIPAETDVVIHSSNLGGYLQLVSTVIDMNAVSGQPAPSKQIAGMLTMTGLNWQTDLIEGATGDFAIFGNLDIQGIMGMMGGQMGSDLPVDFGLVVEMKDAAAASNVATKLGTFIKTMGANADGVTIGTATVNGVEVTNISFPLNPQMPQQVELMLGAKDAVFFFATSDVAQHITGGGNSLTGDTVYSDAANYILPNASSVLYANDEGLIVGLSIPTLAILGPAINNIFNNVVNDLQQSSSLPQNSARQTVQFDPNDQTQQLMHFLEVATSILRSSSISSARDGNVSLTRFVITLE